MPSSHLILWHLLLLLPSIFPSIRDHFSNELAVHIRWPKYWSFCFRINPSNEYSVLISLKIDLLDLLALQEIFRNLLQHHSWKASILWCSAFFIVQLSQPHVTTRKTTALTMWTFVSRVMLTQYQRLHHSFCTQFSNHKPCSVVTWATGMEGAAREARVPLLPKAASTSSELEWLWGRMDPCI